MLKKWFADKYTSNISAVDDMLNRMAYVESKNVATAVQSSNVYDEHGNRVKGKFKEGPGRGLFQFETKGGSGAFQTAINRADSVYKQMLEDGDIKEIPSWIKEARGHDDASKLTPEQQEDLLLADLAQKRVRKTPGLGDKLIKGALEGNVKDLWLQAHWAGAEPGSMDYIKKGKQWEKEMETYKSPFVDKDVEEFESVMSS